MNKILFIANIPSPYRVDFFNELGRFYNLTVVFERGSDIKREWIVDHSFKFNYYILDLRLLSIVSSFKRLRYVIEKEHYDLIILGGYSTIGGILSTLYFKIKRIRYVLNADGGFIKKDNFIKLFIKKFLISSAHYWLSTGENCRGYLIHYGAKKENIYEYPFASVKYSKEELKELSKEEVRYLKEKYKLRDKVILYVGSFIKLKGVEELIGAFEKLKDKDASLLLIGGGELKKEYVTYIEERNIPNIVIMDFIQKEALVDFYKISDIFVLPSRGDVWGLVINEAMSFGLPIVSSNKVGAALDMTKEYKNSLIYESGNIDELKEKLQMLLRDRNLRQDYGEMSRGIIEDYTMEKMVEKHVNIIERIILIEKCKGR